MPDARCDIFGVGALLYVMLTGRSPAEEFVAPSQAHPDATPAVDAVLMRCLAARSRGAFRDAGRGAEALAPLVADAPEAAATGLRRRGRRRHRGRRGRRTRRRCSSRRQAEGRPARPARRSVGSRVVHPRAVPAVARRRRRCARDASVSRDAPRRRRAGVERRGRPRARSSRRSPRTTRRAGWSSRTSSTTVRSPAASSCSRSSRATCSRITGS